MCVVSFFSVSHSLPANLTNGEKTCATHNLKMGLQQSFMYFDQHYL